MGARSSVRGLIVCAVVQRASSNPGVGSWSWFASSGTGCQWKTAPDDAGQQSLRWSVQLNIPADTVNYGGGFETRPDRRLLCRPVAVLRGGKDGALRHVLAPATSSRPQPARQYSQADRSSNTDGQSFQESPPGHSLGLLFRLHSPPSVRTFCRLRVTYYASPVTFTGSGSPSCSPRPSCRTSRRRRLRRPEAPRARRRSWAWPCPQ